MKPNNICAKCHENGTGCCIMHPSEEDFMFGLTDHEIQKIALTCSINENEFVVCDNVSTDTMAYYLKLDSLFSDVMIECKRKRFKLKNGKCFFLTENGCELPVNIRPYYCRLYPFWVNQEKKTTFIPSERCLAQNYAVLVDDLYAIFNTDEAGIKNLYDEYCKIVRD